jgi:Helix-turn-helix domain/RodZ C-terminal domain
MFEIGRSLRTAREHQQRDLAEVERATHIRARYLAALEDERFDALPGTAYAKGMLRTYADYLGLDGSRFVDEFNERFAPTELPEATPPVRVEIPRQLGTRLLLIPLAAGIGLLVWQLASSGGHSHQPAAFIPPVRHVRATTAAAPAPSPPSPQRPARARITLVAARGPCWLSVRAGSQSGRVLYERELQPGQRAGFARPRLWLRLGAPWNLDASLDGKPVRLPSTLGDVIVTKRGVRPA